MVRICRVQEDLAYRQARPTAKDLSQLFRSDRDLVSPMLKVSFLSKRVQGLHADFQ